MNFGLTEEQEVLRKVARRFLDEQAPMTKVREMTEAPEGYSDKLWEQMAELGWLGLTIEDEYGGAGLGWVDLVVLLEDMGRSLLPSPFISTTLAAAAISEYGSPEQKQRLLPALAEGKQIGTLALLEDDDRLGSDGIGLTGRRDGASDGVTSKSYPTIDPTKRVGDLTLENVSVTPADLLAGSGALERLLALAAVAVTAEMVGAAARAHEITVQYAKDRIQFDAPIGKYQGVKHPLAEMYVDVESSKSLLYYAAWCVGEKPGELPLAAARAKAYASDAFARIGVDAIQLHGAIGFTAEYDIQLYLKRSKWSCAAFGEADYHYERVASLGGY